MCFSSWYQPPIWSVDRFYMLLVTELLFRLKLENDWEIFFLVKIFLVLDDDVEDMVMGVQWYHSALKGSPTDYIKILHAKIRGVTNENPIEFGPWGRSPGKFYYWSVP